MNEELMIAAGFAKEMELVRSGRCPLCMRSIKAEEFRDEISKREFEISGLCQMCQDITFKGEEDECGL